MDNNDVVFLKDLREILDNKIYEESKRNKREAYKLAFSSGDKRAEEVYFLKIKIGELNKTIAELRSRALAPADVPTSEHSPMQNVCEIKQVNKEALNFKNKEIKEMPILKDCKIRIKNGYFEVSFRKFGYNKYFVSKKLTIAKRKMHDWLAVLNIELKSNANKQLNKYSSFITFADNFMINIKKPRIAENSWKSYFNKYKNYIQKPYKNFSFKDLTPSKLQMDLDLLKSKHSRTCEDVKVLLNQIFEFAVNSEVIKINPLKTVFIDKHERTPGVALTLEDEKKLVEDIKGTKYEYNFLTILYSGCRPCELDSVVHNFENNTVTIRNLKLKRYQKVKNRVIPIFPKLKTVLLNLSYKKITENALNGVFKKFAPNYTLQDLRHTFSTRAKECGCNSEVVNFWQAHAPGKDMTARVYTHFTMDFMQEEAKKLNYSY